MINNPLSSTPLPQVLVPLQNAPCPSTASADISSAASVSPSAGTTGNAADSTMMTSTLLQMVVVILQMLVGMAAPPVSSPFSLPASTASSSFGAPSNASPAAETASTSIPAPSPQTPTPAPVTQSPQTTQPTSPVGTQPPNSVSVKDFGAVGDGKADDQAALQKAFDEAKATGKSVWLPPGTYNHSGVLTIDGTTVTGAGNGTVLHATNPDQGAIKLTGNNSAISDIETTVMAPNRSSMPNAAAILVQNASNASVSRVRVQGASSNGIRLDNATGSKIENNLVLGTNADGIALMNGSGNNLVKGNVVYQAGDDSYSDDSYASDAKQDENNVFDGNLALDNAYGRGIALAGSKNATIRNNIVSGSRWIGIWGDSDPNSGTMQSSGHIIENNTVINNPNGAPVQSNGPGGKVSGTQTTGSVPSLISILGWDPGALPDRKSFNTVYIPGSGPGANNTAGNRT